MVRKMRISTWRIVVVFCKLPPGVRVVILYIYCTDYLGLERVYPGGAHECATLHSVGPFRAVPHGRHHCAFSSVSFLPAVSFRINTFKATREGRSPLRTLRVERQIVFQLFLREFCQVSTKTEVSAESSPTWGRTMMLCSSLLCSLYLATRKVTTSWQPISFQGRMYNVPVGIAAYCLLDLQIHMTPRGRTPSKVLSRILWTERMFKDCRLTRSN